MEAFLTSTLAVALAEIGDKTQLLTLILIARYPKPWSIAFGIFVATLANHGLSALLGEWLAALIPSQFLPWLIGGSFLLLAGWILIPDKDDDSASQNHSTNAFLIALTLFFIAEIGDKTQIATLVLAAKYNVFSAVVAGTTLGMLLANLPVIWLGKKIMAVISPDITRKISFGLFALVGLATILAGVFN